jgi:hypothetical protein
MALYLDRPDGRRNGCLLTWKILLSLQAGMLTGRTGRIEN